MNMSYEAYRKLASLAVSIANARIDARELCNTVGCVEEVYFDALHTYEALTGLEKKLEYRLGYEVMNDPVCVAEALYYDDLDEDEDE